MKIVTSIFENVANIQWFPIIGLVIFLILFIALIIRIFRMETKVVDEIARLPLDDDENMSDLKRDQ